ncbi:unnamed protein product, partial [Amoebophrya sp. A25]
THSVVISVRTTLGTIRVRPEVIHFEPEENGASPQSPCTTVATRRLIVEASAVDYPSKTL